MSQTCKKILHAFAKNSDLRNVVLAVILSLLITIGIPFFVQPAKATTPTILSNSGYIDYTARDYIICGEIQNLDILPICHVEITATFYDSSNNTITEECDYAGLTIILPNQKSPIWIDIWNDTQASQVDHYTLEVTSYDYTSTLPLNLKILSSNASIVGYGWLTITGEVENAEAIDAKSPAIWATCYDSNGNVVDTFFDYYTGGWGSNQSPGQKSSFEIIISPERAPLVKSYVLATESDLLINFISTITPTPTIPNSFDDQFVKALYEEASNVAVVAIVAVAIAIAVLFVLKRKILPKKESHVSGTDAPARLKYLIN